MSNTAENLYDNARRFADPATGKLELAAVLEGLLQEGLIEESNSQLLLSLSQPNNGAKELGPLERIANSGWSLPGDETVSYTHLTLPTTPYV